MERFGDHEHAAEETAQLARGLRAAMSAFVDQAGARRVLPTVFRVGRPGGTPAEQWAVLDDPGYDAGLRSDLVEQALAMVDVERPCPWLTRSGTLVPGDADLAWFAASRLAYARLGLDLPGFFVITRHGWLNLMTDTLMPVPGLRPRKRRRRA
jgi:hypothetical protein